MASITPLWRSDAISVHRFDHPAEHEDLPYEEVASDFVASFVEAGSFDLEVGNRRWRVGAGDVMLQRPDMRFRASFEGRAFNDTCLSIVYRGAAEDGFDRSKTWERANHAVLAASGRLGYLRFCLGRAIDAGQPMLAEHCAAEFFFANFPRSGRRRRSARGGSIGMRSVSGSRPNESPATTPRR